MLWRRFADPMSLLQTYNLIDTAKFISFVQDREAEDILWDKWTHFKPTKKQGKNERYLNFDEFKKQQGISIEKKAPKVTVEEEAKSLEFASKFIKPRKES
jgi:ABC-type Fe3+ transport system substrate-binding protein